jgi:hypothetical protein
MKDKCKNCLYYESDNNFCRRYPPYVIVLSDKSINIFPEINEFEWCGEFKEKEEDDDNYTGLRIK